MQEAFETTTCRAGSKSPSLTPMTNVASASFDGAEMIDPGCARLEVAAAAARLVKRPVDSMTTSTPRSPQPSAFGSRSAKNGDVPAADAKAARRSSLDMLASRPCVESYLSR